jgi:hypothetical protein
MSQPISIRPTSEGEVDGLLSKAVGCAEAAGERPAQRDRVIADYLRHHLCHLAQPLEAGESAAAVHVHRLLANVRHQLGAWLPERDVPDWAEEPEGQDDEDESEEALAFSDLGMRLLRRLVFLRDAARCGRGYYQPAPVRLVPLPSRAALAVGSLPTGALAGQVRAPIVWAGTCRAVGGEALGQVPATVPRQPLADWMGLPGADLTAWTGDLLAEAADRLVPSAPETGRMRFEVYAPGLRPRLGQLGRWLAPSEWRGSSQELTLCRTLTRPTRFWLAPLEGARGEALFRRETPVAPSLARRLMYGLDQRTGAPVPARINAVPQHPRERELQLASWPAWEELRLLQALAADVTPFQKQHLPLCFRFSMTWWPDIRWALNNLGLRVEGAVPG